MTNNYTFLDEIIAELEQEALDLYEALLEDTDHNSNRERVA